MKILQIIYYIQQSNYFLYAIGLTSFLLAAILFILMQFYHQTILGINRWIKPSKFAISAAIYVWTMAIILSYIKYHTIRYNIYTTIVGVSMIVEVALILIQSARGTTSHFNITNNIDKFIFNIMGLFIFINTVICVQLLIDFFILPIYMPSDMLWAIRLGLVLFLLGSAEAGFMLSLNRHTVGAADGGAGLAYLNWSTQHGDLRVAHFVGLHSLQILPILAWLLAKTLPDTPAPQRTMYVAICALVILGGFVYVLWQALQDRPLVSVR